MNEAQLCNLPPIINQHVGWFQAFATAAPTAVNILVGVPLDTCWTIVVSSLMEMTLLSLSAHTFKTWKDVDKLLHILFLFNSSF